MARMDTKEERYLACHQRAKAAGIETMDARDEWMRRYVGEFGLTVVAEVFGVSRQRAHQIVRGV